MGILYEAHAKGSVTPGDPIYNIFPYYTLQANTAGTAMEGTTWADMPVDIGIPFLAIIGGFTGFVVYNNRYTYMTRLVQDGGTLNINNFSICGQRMYHNIAAHYLRLRGGIGLNCFSQYNEAACTHDPTRPNDMQDSLGTGQCSILFYPDTINMLNRDLYIAIRTYPAVGETLLKISNGTCSDQTEIMEGKSLTRDMWVLTSKSGLVKRSSGWTLTSAERSNHPDGTQKEFVVCFDDD